MLLHEDYPHTIPTRAYLRWKENYFWVLMDVDRDVYCLAHVSAEPTYDRAYASCTLIHQGRRFTSSKEVPLPQPFVHQRELTFGGLTLRFLKPQAEFEVAFAGDEFDLRLTFTRRMNLFDFLACADLNPDSFSVSENTAMAREGFRHQGQCMTGCGTVVFKGGDWAGKRLGIDGIGYRDHSWGMRNDQLTLDHNWTFVNLPSHGFHFFRVRNIVRPENTVMEGYVATPEGNQALRSLSIEQAGEGAEGMPETVRYSAVAYDGTRYTVVADVGDAFARLPLVAQKPGNKTYLNVENMCRCRCEETGETGLANVEIGMLRDA